MTLHRFYYPGQLEGQTEVTLSSTESAHAIKVLRLRPGDELVLLDGCGTEARAVMQPPRENRRLHDAVCSIRQVIHHVPESQPVHLYVAPPKSKNMDLVLKSATELGVSVITPILCRYGVSRVEGTGKDAWDNPLIAAIKQSSNPWLPRLEAPVDFMDALKTAGTVGYFGAVPRDDEPVSPPPWERPEGETSLWIGPEGGFSAEEEEALRVHGFHPLTVGRWILRVETAVTALLACMAIRMKA